MARNERSIVGQCVLMADQEIGKAELSQNDSSLVYKYYWSYLYSW